MENEKKSETQIFYEKIKDTDIYSSDIDIPNTDEFNDIRDLYSFLDKIFPNYGNKSEKNRIFKNLISHRIQLKQKLNRKEKELLENTLNEQKKTEIGRKIDRLEHRISCFFQAGYRTYRKNIELFPTPKDFFDLKKFWILFKELKNDSEDNYRMIDLLTHHSKMPYILTFEQLAKVFEKNEELLKEIICQTYDDKLPINYNEFCDHEVNQIFFNFIFLQSHFLDLCTFI